MDDLLVYFRTVFWPDYKQCTAPRQGEQVEKPTMEVKCRHKTSFCGDSSTVFVGSPRADRDARSYVGCEDGRVSRGVRQVFEEGELGLILGAHEGLR